MVNEGDTFGINGSFGTPKKSLVLVLAMQRQSFTWVYIIVSIIVICLMERKS